MAEAYMEIYSKAMDLHLKRLRPVHARPA
jgi:hypothetical protein